MNQSHEFIYPSKVGPVRINLLSRKATFTILRVDYIKPLVAINAGLAHACDALQRLIALQGLIPVGLSGTKTEFYFFPILDKNKHLSEISVYIFCYFKM